MPWEESDRTLYMSVMGHLRNTAQATKIVKGFLLLGGALIAGIAQFLDIDPAGIKANQIVGIIGSVAVFLAALWSLIKEQDATEELKIAVRAKEEADERKDALDSAFEVFEDMERAAHLIVGGNVLRGYIEHICSSEHGKTEEEIMSAIFSMAGRAISLSMGLSGNDEWTICVYKAHSEPAGKDKLRLIEHVRAIQCEKSAAREWEEGVGVAGICYSTGREVVVPNFQSDGLGTLFNVGTRQRDYDSSRYQSIVAVPIQVDKSARPWGVITATSDRPYHFRPSLSGGVETTEGARVLAGFIALAVSIKAKLAGPEQSA